MLNNEGLTLTLLTLTLDPINAFVPNGRPNKVCFLNPEKITETIFAVLRKLP